MTAANTQQHIIESPLGQLELIERDGYLTHCHFTQKAASTAKPSLLLEKVEKQLKAYFEGKCQSFNLPLAPYGTPFQASVWQVLLKISYGETWSYKRVASEIKNLQAVRAVGSANGKNPICIIIPCHRVVRASGELGGYAGGVNKKTFLLSLESEKVDLVSYS